MPKFKVEATSVNKWTDRSTQQDMEKSSTVPPFFVEADSEENVRRMVFQILNIHRNPRIQVTIQKITRIE